MILDICVICGKKSERLRCGKVKLLGIECFVNDELTQSHNPILHQRMAFRLDCELDFIGVRQNHGAFAAEVGKVLSEFESSSLLSGSLVRVCYCRCNELL